MLVFIYTSFGPSRVINIKSISIYGAMVVPIGMLKLAAMLRRRKKSGLRFAIVSPLADLMPRQ
jgi:hypothetical protein